MTRSERRHRRDRAKRRTGLVLKHAWGLTPDERFLGKMASVHCRPCSCSMCSYSKGLSVKNRATVTTGDDTMKDWIPLDECRHGRIYRLSSRNLTVGVFNAATKGFIGIREKFGQRYLFTEFHWDTGAPYGTAKPLELLDLELDPRIRIAEREPIVRCFYCLQPVTFDTRWSACDCPPDLGPRPQDREYRPLFEALKEIEYELADGS